MCEAHILHRKMMNHKDLDAWKKSMAKREKREISLNSGNSILSNKWKKEKRKNGSWQDRKKIRRKERLHKRSFSLRNNIPSFKKQVINVLKSEKALERGGKNE